MKMSSYNIIARFFPAILTSIPVLIAYILYFDRSTQDVLSWLLSLKFVFDITLASSVLYLSAQLNRIISKELFEKYLFRGGLDFPTTQILLHKDTTFSSEYKGKVHSKINKDFKIRIPTAAEEKRNEDYSRQTINEAISLVRKKVKRGDLLDQHNAEYGFFRNISGGSIFAFVTSFVNMNLFTFFKHSPTGLICSYILLWIYGILLICAKPLIVISGKAYAKELIGEYIAHD